MASMKTSSPAVKKPAPIEVDSDDEDDVLLTTDEREDETLCVRLISWNLEGAEDPPHPKDLLAVAYASESKCVHIYALQEVKCLEKLREGIWVSMGGNTKFELFEHWMGRSGPGFAGQTVLLVFAPKELCTTGRFRLSRFSNSQVKREVLRGTRFKLLGGTTSSRGAVAMPFTFLDTTFTIVSVRLVEEETAKSLDQQQKDLDKILELCKMSENAETSTVGSIHHAFLCGSFAMGQTSSGPASSATLGKQQNSDSNNNLTGSSSSTQRRSISSRFSFVRKGTAVGNGSSNSSTLGSQKGGAGSSQSANSDTFTQTKQRFAALDDYSEIDGTSMAFDPDHVFYRCASENLENCLDAVSSTLLTNVKCGRPPVSTLFKIKGRGSDLLTSWARVTGNLPIHLSSRSNYVHAKKDVAQRPRISTAPQLRKERESRSNTLDMMPPTSPHRMTALDEKFVLECTRCEAPISDSENIVPVTKDGNAYHARCFCCDHCGIPLCNEVITGTAPGEATSDVAFHEVDGKLLCQKSFETLYLKCCEGCGGALGDEFLVLPSHTANGEEKRFHVSCFKCGICARPFATKILLGDIVVEAAIPHEGMYLCELDFGRAVGGVKCCVCDHSFEKGIKVNGDIYCQRDFQEIFSGGICAVCQKPVDDEQALTLSSTDPAKRRACHMTCLKCAVCSRKLHEMNEAFVEFEGLTYCKEDWDKRQASQVLVNCSKCMQPIREKEHVEAVGKTFHSKCFSCTFCDVSLVGAKFYFSDGRPWCLNDFERFCSPDLPACASCHRTVGSADASKSKHIEGRTWHAECFVCGNCGVSMTGRKPKIIKGKVFCEHC